MVYNANGADLAPGVGGGLMSRKIGWGR